MRQFFLNNNAGSPHISLHNTQEEKTTRLAALSSREQTAYKWLYEGYSEAWTAETLGLKRKDARNLYKSIYHKLGVENQREIIQYYALQEVEFI